MATSGSPVSHRAAAMHHQPPPAAGLAPVGWVAVGDLQLLLL